MAQAMLKLEGITKEYKVADTSVHARKGVSLNFRRKEFVSVLGHSGCGKTTLLNIIGGLDHYTSGDLVIKGVSTKNYKDSDWDAYRNHSIGFVFQSYNLIPHQTVLGNVELALTLSGVSPQERRERAEQALKRVGLEEHLYKKPNQLSGGQMQRVAIARALVNNPEILLADEPTGALDTETSVQIMDLIQEIAGERLVIMVTHNPELARQYSSRIVELKDGLIVSDSNPYNPETEEGSGYIPEPAEAQKGKRRKKDKKNKTSMSFWTAFLLSGRNLLTKKGRTAVTSVAGSIGIISVCLVLALSSGFSAYINQTEEDMLSYYPLQITETALDPAAIMSGFASAGEVPDLSELDNEVYVNSFLTKIAQNMTVSNDISQDGYLDYIKEMPAELFNAIRFDTGAELVNNLFTTVDIKDGAEKESTHYMSLSALKQYYINVLSQQEEQYAQLAYLVDYLGDVVSVMPGTSGNFDTERYSEFVLSQYDIINKDGYFPQEANEAVIVVGGNNDMTDLLLAQLGFISEEDFLGLFDLGGGDIGDSNATEIGEEGMRIPFDDLTGKEYTLYFNDAVYERNENYSYSYTGTDTANQYPFRYNSERGDEEGESTDLEVTDGNGVKVKVTAVLRLKDGLTYGCLSDGLNLTEKLIEEYIQENKDSQIVQWMNTEVEFGVSDLIGSSVENPDPSKNQGGKYTVGDSVLYRAPVEGLNSSYYSRITKESLPEEMQGVYELLQPWVRNMFVTNSMYNESTIRMLGGEDTPNAVSIYPTDFNTKEEVISYLEGWNTLARQELQSYKDAHGGSADGYAGKTEVTYTDTVGMLMGMVQTILDAITYVLVAFTGISLVVSTVMIGVITYVSVVERTKEIGILRAIGARKKDIKHVFNAETFIIGLCSGLFGVAVAYILQVIINLILTPLTGIAGLASLQWYSALVMVVISVLLTLISGLFPASAAAKRDPVVALRTE